MHTVLLVDDEPSELELGTLFLERGGELRVVPFSSAAAALEALRDRPCGIGPATRSSPTTRCPAWTASRS